MDEPLRKLCLDLREWELETGWRLQDSGAAADGADGGVGDGSCAGFGGGRGGVGSDSGFSVGNRAGWTDLRIFRK